MKQIVQSPRGSGVVCWNVPPPQIRPGQILVRVDASLISAGTERMVTGFAGKSLIGKARARPDLVRQVRGKVQRDGLAAAWNAINARLDEPMPLGYSAAGEVLEVGEGLEGHFHPGDMVAIAGAGEANHAEIDLVPANLAARLPVGTKPEQACFSTLGAIALHSVRLVRPQLGEWVGVVGLGLVGLLALQFARLSGARVLALDYDQARLDLAGKLGAEHTLNLADNDPAEVSLALTGRLGCDAVIIAAATDSAEPFETAASIARDRAVVCLVGITGTAFPYRSFMQKELSIVTARSYGPGRYDKDFERNGMSYPPGYVRWTETENLRTAVRLIATAELAVDPLISHRMRFEDAGSAYAMIKSGSEPHLGVVLNYPARPETAPNTYNVTAFPKPSAAIQAERCVLGVVGAGRFANAVVLPKLAETAGVSLASITSARGLSAENAARKHGFSTVAGSASAIFADPSINAVLILTPHGSHAEQTVSALEAGKAVLVEKPLGVSLEELDQIAMVRTRSASFFQVGFNRRFAPMTLQLQEFFRDAAGPKHIFIRANAGRLSGDAWELEAAHGGGRLLGELCHFVDLAHAIGGSPVCAVQAAAGGQQNGVAEEISAHLELADGSIATIAYSASGDTAYSKETVEVFAAGQVARIDDFRRLELVRRGKRKVARARQDKGHSAQLQAFADAVRRSSGPPVSENAFLNSSAATIAIRDAIRFGRRQLVGWSGQ